MKPVFADYVSQTRPVRVQVSGRLQKRGTARKPK
jgi:hypothetical protein